MGRKGGREEKKGGIVHGGKHICSLNCHNNNTESKGLKGKGGKKKKKKEGQGNRGESDDES